MPGDAGQDLSWHLSGGLTNGVADLSLGGIRSNVQFRTAPGLLTANAAAGDVRIFNDGNIGFQADGYLYFRFGASGGFASRVVDSNVGAGWVQLLDPLPFSAAIGDQVWAFRRTATSMPFQDTTALESADGIDHYIGLYVVNGGGALTDFRLYLEDLNGGGVAHEIAASNDSTFVLPTIGDETTPPSLAAMLAGGGAGYFSKALSVDVPNPAPFSFPAASQIGFWIRRTGVGDSLRLSDQAFRIIGEDPTAGVFSQAILNWDTIGFTPVLSLTHAPTVYLRGGARFKTTVTSLETGLRVPNVPVTMRQTAGPGTFSPPPAPGETDENGEALGRYAAPTDIGEIGNTFDVEATV